jgi:hypothetical protein
VREGDDSVRVRRHRQVAGEAHVARRDLDGSLFEDGGYQTPNG